MYILFLKQFLRSRAVVLSLILILVIGVISILIGEQFLTRHEKTVTEVTRHQQEHITRNVNFHNDDLGLLLYYVRFTLINAPNPLAALSIGQRDVNPSIQSVTIRNLEGQRYDTDLTNPSNLQAGNLDLGFVIIYLFPLLIIAFMYDLLSAEQETGTWRLVAVQSTSTRRFIWTKVSIRALLLYALLIILFSVAILKLSLPLSGALLLFVLLSMLYLAFWFALCFWIVSFQHHSNINVLTLLSLWVVLAILLPASVNNFLTNRYPVPEALSTMVQQRDGYHEKWDMDKSGTMSKFYEHYPQYRKYALPDEDFSWLWYYAMQQAGDDDAHQFSLALREKIGQRDRSSHLLALVIPTMHTQLQFNELAQTGLSNHLDFLDQTYGFHEQLRLHFYPKIFENALANEEDWGQFRPEYLDEHREIDGFSTLLPPLLLTLLLFVFTTINLRRI